MGLFPLLVNKRSLICTPNHEQRPITPRTVIQTLCPTCHGPEISFFFFSCNMNCTFDRGRKQKEASRENYKYWDLTKWEWVGHTHSVESLGLQMSSFISNNHHRWLKCLTQASVLLFSGEWGWGGQQLLAIACTLLIWGKQFSGKLTSNCVVPKPRKSEHAIQETDLQH